MANGRADIMRARGEVQLEPKRAQSTVSVGGGAVRSTQNRAKAQPATAPMRKAIVNDVTEVDPIHTSIP